MRPPPLTRTVREFLARQRVARLATADAAGAPHVVPVCYVVIDAQVYFTIDAKPKPSPTTLRRLRNVAANPRCAVVVDRYEDDWTQLGFVQLEGLAERVSAVDEHGLVLAELRQRYPQYGAMRLTIGDYPMIRIHITHWHTWGKLTE